MDVFIVGSQSMSKDCALNYEILKNMGIKIYSITNSDDLVGLKDALVENDMTIDAIFGVGLNRNVEGIQEKVIKIINNRSSYTLSVDIPSGMKCNSFGIFGTSIKSNKTVSFEVYKRGFLDYEGEKYTGEIIIEKIAIPDYVVNKFHNKEYLLEINDIKNILKKRKKYEHKGDFGRVTIMAGSENFTGAAYICSQAAVRSGAGLITLCTKKSIVDILKNKNVETMTMSYEDDNFEKVIGNSDCIAMGPGMGNDEFTLKQVSNILSKEGCPLVLDADALNVLTYNLGLLKNCKRNIVITPHIGEMSRLTGIDINELVDNRIEVAKSFAKEYGVMVLLKGYNTIITDGNEVYINSTGNSKMASGGMGDTLTGIIASFIGQGYEPFKATILGAYTHGYCGDVLSKDMFCVNASHIIDRFPYVLESLMD